MEKTVLVVVGNNLSSSPCGQVIALDLPQGGGGGVGGGKGGKGVIPGKAIPSIPKSVWTCNVEAVSEYCRVVLDLFPNLYQVCVAAVDEAKCQPINSWRDEDQDISKVDPALLVWARRSQWYWDEWGWGDRSGAQWGWGNHSGLGQSQWDWGDRSGLGQSQWDWAFTVGLGRSQ